MITFRLVSAHHDKEIVLEVLCDGEVSAAIYPASDGTNNVKIVSAHMVLVSIDDGRNSKPPIPAVAISFARHHQAPPMSPLVQG
jgi:hypothetical protein